MIYAATYVGTQHEYSEDTVLIGTQLITEKADTFTDICDGFVCIADGVGGNYGGAEASSFVLSNLAKCVPVSIDDLQNTINQINEQLVGLNAIDIRYSSMATTLTGIYHKADENWIFHIGNTRLYVMQGRYLKQITADHTTYQWLINLGRTEDADACNKNELIACLGGGSTSFASKLYVTAYPKVSRMIITSDGIHDHVCIDALERVLNQKLSGMEQCMQIIKLAQKNGSEDDLSIVLIDWDDIQGNAD